MRLRSLCKGDLAKRSAAHVAQVVIVNKNVLLIAYNKRFNNVITVEDKTIRLESLHIKIKSKK